MIEIHGPDSLLEKEVKLYLSIAEFSPKCSGKQVKLQYTFQLSGMANESMPAPSIIFKPPNHFVLETRPPKAILD